MRRTRLKNMRSVSHSEAICLHDNISMCVRYDRFMPRLLIRIATALLGIICAFLCVQGFYHFTVDLKQVLEFVTVTTVIVGCIYRLPKKMRWAIVALLLGFELFVYGYWQESLAGYRSVYRTITSQIRHTPRIVDSLTSTDFWSEQTCTTFFICSILFIIVICLTYFVVARPNFIMSFILTFPLLESGLFFGYETNSLAVFGLVAFWIVVLVIHFSQSKISHKRDTEKKSKSGLYFTQTSGRNSVAESAAILMLAFLMLGSLIVIRATKNYQRSEKIDRQRFELQSKLDSISFNQLSELISQIPLPFEANLLVDEVELSSQGHVEFHGGDILKIQFPGLMDYRNYYFKGLARGQYTGKGWTKLKQPYHDAKSLLNDLVEQKKYPPTLDLYSEEYSQDALKSLQIEAVHSEQVNYIPYEAVIGDQSLQKVVYDTEVRYPSQKKYEVQIAPNTNVDFDYVPFGYNTMRSPDPTLQAYEDFVAEAYCEKPTELSDQLMEVFETYCQGNWVNGIFSSVLQPDTYGTILDAIKQFIWDKASYTLSPGNTPTDKDFVTYFLEENHLGYCAHYASAGVLLCRAMGIPARYCQGYVVSATDYAAACNAMNQAQSEVTVNVHDYRAHAWAEIFIPLIGWVPYEFTEDVQTMWNNVGMPVEPTPEVTTAVTTSITKQTTTTIMTTTLSSTATNTSTTHTVTVIGNENSKHKTMLTKAQKTVLLTAIVILLLVALGIMLWRQKHAQTVAGRKHKMRAKDPNAAATASYSFIVKLLAMEGVKQGNLSHEKFVKLAQSKCKLLPEGGMAEVVAIQEAVVFSGTEITREDADKVYEIAQNLAKAIYENADAKRKFKLRWFRHIVE